MQFLRTVLVGALSFGLAELCQAQSNLSWPYSGQNLSNTRSAPGETKVGVDNASRLATKWVFNTYGDITATPSVDAAAKVLYVPDYAGYLYKINTDTGKAIWTLRLSDYGLPSGTYSRNTPAISGNMIVLAAGGALGRLPEQPVLLAIDSATGNLIWRVQADPDPYALMTGSPIVYQGAAYIGISSEEEILPNPTFRGSIAAFDLATGSLLWRQYMVPLGYSGGAVWSGTPALDVERGLLYITTGNNYTVPEHVEKCEQMNALDPIRLPRCQDPKNYFDSVVALELKTGKVKWGTRLSLDDAWLAICLFPIPSTCPKPTGDDYDFGSGANLFTALINGKQTDVVGAGQKSGHYWALNRDTGAILWNDEVGPGGKLGGIMWGTATDGHYVYIAEANGEQKPYLLRPSGTPWNGGSWKALDAATGNSVWQVKDPGKSTVFTESPAMTLGPVSVANGVLYAPSMSGFVYALDASSGRVLWSFDTGGSVAGGAAIVDGVVYWGTGYFFFGLGTSNHKLFAFALPPQ